MLYPLRYYWRVTRGHRLRPWRSPYLAWRLETFFGPAAQSAARSPRAFFRLLWHHRHRLASFLHWAAHLERDYFHPSSHSLP